MIQLMNTRSRGVFFATLAGVGMAAAGEVMAPSFSVTTNHVAEGASVVQADRVLVSPEAVLRKTGGGAWKIPLTYLAQTWPAVFDVEEGTLEFGVGSQSGSYASPTSLPDSIAAKALIWVDAADPVASHIAETDAGVSVWYDRREGADVSSPSYCRASAYTGYTATLPAKSTVDGNLPAIYFGGVGSGCCMEFTLPSGSRFDAANEIKGVRHVFAVHKAATTFGEIFGTFTSTPTSFMRDGRTASAYIWKTDDCWPSLVNGRTYRNGRRIDGTLTEVGAELQLLEAERAYNVRNVVGGLFASTSVGGSGGDYICEALAFTNRLSEAERLAITGYLMAKWMSDADRTEASIHVAEGATVKVDASEADVAYPRFSLTGNGTLLKTGSHSFTYDNDSSEAFDGTVSMDEGSIVLRAPAAIAISGAGRVTSVNTVAGPTVSLTADATGKTLHKDGNDLATIRAVPSGIERVSVEAGTLSVRKAPSFRREDVFEEVPLRDGGFEEYAPYIAASTSGRGVIGGNDVSIARGGWGYVSGNCYAMDYDRWMELGKGMDGASLSDWSLNTHPPEGKCALVLRIGKSTTTDDTVVRSEPVALEAGTYELRFQMSGRQVDDYRGQIFRARFVGGTGDDGVKAEFGDMMYQDTTDYTYCRLRTKIADAGNYRIELRTLHGRNGLIILDDMRLFKVKPSFSGSARWNIPGGDFETDSMPQGKACKRFSVEHTHPGWTFTQSSAWTAGNRAKVGISTICTTNGTAGYGTGVFYNNSRRPATGSMELCFTSSNCCAETTFTPPAGTWRLQGDIARFGSCGVYPKVTATAAIGGEEKNLGTLSPLSRLMGPMAWPKSFTVDGTQPVTLRLSASGIRYLDSASSHGLLVDDLALAGATDLELFRDGSCEGIDGSYALKTVSASSMGGNGQCLSRTPNESNAAFGTRTVDGSRMVTIQNMSILYEDVTFPFAGRYRLSFYVHSRFNDKTGNNQPNPLRAWIAADGVTNVIGYADTYNSEWVQRVFDFSVPAAGVWRVALQGCHNPGSTSAKHEAHVDSISLKQIPEAADRTPPFPENCKIAVDEGARLEVDFSGTNTVRGLRLGSRRLGGIVEVADHPEHLGGRGAFNIVPDGTIVSFR